MENILSAKNDVCEHLTTLFGRFGLGNLLRHQSLEKQVGISAVILILALCLFRINGSSIFGAYKTNFGGLLNTGKKCSIILFTAIHLLTSTKKTFSALEMQRQLGHKRMGNDA